jgi:hypothetical protein
MGNQEIDMKYALVLIQILIASSAFADQSMTYNGKVYSCPDNTTFQISNGVLTCKARTQREQRVQFNDLVQDLEEIQVIRNDADELRQKYNCPDDGNLVVINNVATCNGEPVEAVR